MRLYEPKVEEFLCNLLGVCWDIIDIMMWICRRFERVLGLRLSEFWKPLFFAIQCQYRHQHIPAVSCTVLIRCVWRYSLCRFQVPSLQGSTSQLLTCTPDFSLPAEMPGAKQQVGVACFGLRCFLQSSTGTINFESTLHDLWNVCRSVADPMHQRIWERCLFLAPWAFRPISMEINADKRPPNGSH